MNSFNLISKFEPAGDQPKAIENICESFGRGDPHHTLLGVTGSGKTFTMAKVIQKLNRPTLIIAPNKTLAGQLFSEFKQFFPDDHVGYFISYYDYYQPEAYVPSSDTYIAKDSSINEDIDKMRHKATQDLFEKRNTIIIASVSCIYGLGSPSAYANLVVPLEVGMEISRNQFLHRLIEVQYSRNDKSLMRGYFRVRGDVVDVLPANSNDEAIRVEFFGDEIDEISIVDSLTGTLKKKVQDISLYPNSHYVTEKKDKKSLIQEILHDLGIRLRELRDQNKLVEYQRLEQRVMQDVETIEQFGFCPGIENYSRYLSGTKPGDPPPTLLNYFPPDFLTIIDESHITIPQIGGMFRGDRARKQVLVDFGFRLPSALDNRPLNFEEFKSRTGQVLYVSATPGDYEVDISGKNFTELLIRPTGLLDPEIEIRPAKTQIDDLLLEARKVVDRGGRILVTTLTKRMAEDLSSFMNDEGFRVRYLHSDIDTLQRSELLRDLRKGVYDILIGINLLREGLDLPEVELVAIMDADKEGFLRSRRSLIQIVGRAARNAKAKVYFYAEQMTGSMQEAIDETERRRIIQASYNDKHNITPTTVFREFSEDLRALYGLTEIVEEESSKTSLAEIEKKFDLKTPKQIEKEISKLSKKMQTASGKLEFEEAMGYRDDIQELKKLLLAVLDGKGDA